MKHKKTYQTPEMTVHQVGTESGFMAASPIKAEVKVTPFEENTESLEDFVIGF